jgi:mRNA interferase HicA
MMEIDPHYCDVIIDRYIAYKEADENVILVRDGKEVTYAKVKNIEKSKITFRNLLILYVRWAYNIFRKEGTMKRRDLIKNLEENGWELLRNGGDHDVYRKGNRREPVPRSREIKKGTAEKIIKRCGLK